MNRKTLAFTAALVLILSVIVFVQGENTAAAAPEVMDEQACMEHINIGLASQLTTLDPGSVSNVQHYYLFNMVYNTLLSYDNHKKELSGELAKSWSFADDTFKVIRIELQPDVLFHDGSKLTADDVAFSLGRSTSALVANSYDHCEILDEKTLNIVLKEANVDFLYVLTHNSSAVVSKAAVEGNAESGTQIGTGPWAIKTVAAGDSVELVRFDDYWSELPKTKSITLRYYGNASARLIALENNEIQLMTDIIQEEIPNAKANKNITVDEFNTTQMFYLAFNNRQGPGTNENLRHAIAHAINRDDIIFAVGDTGAAPAYSFFGWHMAQYFTDFAEPNAFDLNKAKEFAAKTNGQTTLKLMVNSTNSTYYTMAQMIQAQCADAGITIELEEVDSAGATANSKFATPTHEALLYSINMNDWDSDMGRLMSLNSNTNKAILENQRILELLSKGVSSNDTETRKSSYQEIQQIIHDNSYYIPLYYSTGNIAYQKGLTGIGLAFNNAHDYSYICIPMK